MKIIAFDPSGNFGREGMGTTGITVMVDGEVKELKELKAKDFSSEVEYWAAHEDYIQQEWPDHVRFEGYKLYNHKGMSASTQANSELQTPQLIGVLKLVCHRLNIPYSVKFASDIKTRWSEDVLVRSGILEQKGNRYYWNGQITSTHKRDSLKHALHYWRYQHEGK
jgi:hypothetical protein